MLLIAPKEGCGHLGSGFGRMFYSCISFFWGKVAISLAPTIVSPFPSADSALVCVASTEATHIVFSEALSNARFFVFFTFCIADVTCDFFSTKETVHMVLSAQIVARFAV